VTKWTDKTPDEILAEINAVALDAWGWGVVVPRRVFLSPKQAALFIRVAGLWRGRHPKVQGARKRKRILSRYARP